MVIYLKKIITLVVLFIVIVSFKSDNVKAIEYYARSYIVMDYNTGEVLESKDMHLQRSVASISKIMTAIVALENSSLDKYVEVNEDILKAYGSSIYLKIGEVVTMQDLLYGLMLRSGNDAAVTIARGVSGSVEAFVELMNKKAKEIGMVNSLFSNPSGLDVDDDGNLSTSYDMALLMRYALRNDKFREITSTKEYKSNSHGTWLNKNRLLRQYEYTSGGPCNQRGSDRDANARGTCGRISGYRSGKQQYRYRTSCRQGAYTGQYKQDYHSGRKVGYYRQNIFFGTDGVYQRLLAYKCEVGRQ